MLFFAITTNEVLLADADLAKVLAELAEIQSPDLPEDAVVWQSHRVVCIRHPDGRITWLQPQHRPAIAAVA